MHARLIETVTGATGSASVDESADRTSQRILDAALAEATAVGLDRITVEDVVLRAGVSRMTAYRRYPRRDDLVEALMRRVGQAEPAVIGDWVEPMAIGAAFIANYIHGYIHGNIHGKAPGTPSQPVRWVADVFARLFFTYISAPPSDPAFGDDAELRRFAHDVLTPMVERAAT